MEHLAEKCQACSLPFRQEVAVLGFKRKHPSSRARDSEQGAVAPAATPSSFLVHFLFVMTDSSVGRWMRILKFICRA